MYLPHPFHDFRLSSLLFFVFLIRQMALAPLSLTRPSTIHLSLHFYWFVDSSCCLSLSLAFTFDLVCLPALFPLAFPPPVPSPDWPTPLCLCLFLFLSSRKSLSTICLAVMNPEPFRTNQLGQINETLGGDKLCVSVCARECVSVCVCLKYLIIRWLYHFI